MCLQLFSAVLAPGSYNSLGVTAAEVQLTGKVVLRIFINLF